MTEYRYFFDFDSFGKEPYPKPKPEPKKHHLVKPNVVQNTVTHIASFKISLAFCGYGFLSWINQF